MPNRIRLPAAALTTLLLALLALAGCGGSGDDTTSSPADTTEAGTTADESTAAQTSGEQPALDPHVAAEKAITEFLTSPDVESACARLSPPLLSETYGDLAGCRNGRPPESLAKSVAIDDIEVDGEQVTATAKPEGGSYDGVEVSFQVAVHGDLFLITGIDADVPVGP